MFVCVCVKSKDKERGKEETNEKPAKYGYEVTVQTLYYSEPWSTLSRVWLAQLIHKAKFFLS